jgi:nucleotide-binding universal stress UspA family protein
MLKLLIPVDGSEHSQHAIEAVAKLAQAQAQLELILLHVASPPAFYGELTPAGFQELDSAVRTNQARVLEGAAKMASDCGLKVIASKGVTGMVAPEIVRMASESGVDQIVMGTRGMGALGGVLLGSVAQRVVHMAAVPVLLVK